MIILLLILWLYKFISHCYNLNKLIMLYTPVKPKDSFKRNTSDSTFPSTNKKEETLIDLKSKLLDLLNENIDLKGKQKAYLSRIEKLEQDAQIIKKQTATFLRKANCSNLAQAYQKLQSLQVPLCQPNFSPLREVALQLKQSLVSKSVNQYATKYYQLMINKKLEAIQQKYQGNVENSQKQKKKLKDKFEAVEEECLILRQENRKLVERNQKIKHELNKSIQKYESIEMVVEDKLKYYIEKMKDYEEELKRYRSQRLDFSFARDDKEENETKMVQSFLKEVEIHEKNQEQKVLNSEIVTNQAENDVMSAQCYRASIEGLLEQNKRLKKSFHSLYRLKQGEQLPAELQKQINIMHSILELSQFAEEVIV